MHETRPPRGLIDTSVVIGLDRIDSAALPHELSVSTLTLAELSAGPAAASDPAERARRQDRLQRAEAAFDALPFDSATARAYGRLYASLIDAGRRPRDRRTVDLLIAATALAAGMPLYTCNPRDFNDLADVEIVAVAPEESRPPS